MSKDSTPETKTEETKSNTRPTTYSSKLVFREYFESLSVAIVLALVIRFFVLTAYKIPTGSMIPTLKVGDFVFASKLSYGVPIPFSSGKRLGEKMPQRSDVIVFRFPADESIHYVKRIVGLPGDRIEIRDKKLIVNEKVLDYSPLNTDEIIGDLPGKTYFTVLAEQGSKDRPARTIMIAKDNETEFFGPVIVPPEHVFVLGDNRDSSEDSRYWGMVPLRNIEGRVFVIWMSFDWNRSWAGGRLPGVRWERLFDGIK